MEESGSDTVRRLLRADRPATSRLSEAEVISALARRAREGAYRPAERDRALSALKSDLAAIYVVELVPEISARTYGLLLRHRLRASDALQLASCLHLQERVGAAVQFVAFDERLNGAAAAEGLQVLG